MYFINHGRVRSLKFLPWQWKGLAGLLIILVLWLAVSSIWIYRTSQSLIVTKERLAASQQAVFDYQERHSKVYEQVYPDLHAPENVSYPFETSTTPDTQNNLNQQPSKQESNGTNLENRPRVNSSKEKKNTTSTVAPSPTPSGKKHNSLPSSSSSLPPSSQRR